MSNLDHTNNHEQSSPRGRGRRESIEPPSLEHASLPSGRTSRFEGVTETQVSKKEKVVSITFAEAAAHAPGKPSFVPRWSEDRSYEIWHDDNLRIVLSKIGPDKVAENPKLPPYTATLMAQPEKHFYMQTGKATSSLSGDTGHIISAGTERYDFFADHGDTYRKKTAFSVTIELDQVNDWSYPERPPVSPESREIKKAWNRFWKNDPEGSTGFFLEPTARKKLEMKTVDDMRKLDGPAELIKIWERDNDAPLEEQYGWEELHVFAYDPKSKTYGIAEYTSGESDHRLYIFDAKGHFVGFYRVDDTGGREWLEAFPGELGKPE